MTRLLQNDLTAISTDSVSDQDLAPPTSSRPRKEQEIRGCRWIDGDTQTDNWRYCQAPRLKGSSYCADHHARSINPDGDPEFAEEQAEVDTYLADLPPPEDD